MQNTTNVFLDGLTTDLHPLTTKNNQLTDALNATLRTFNGNELVLQNDMGNTMIQDSTTGNIMGLRDGFVPVGMKEYGGILYIASYNIKTDEGELGTIPSPVFNYTYQNTPYNCNFGNKSITNISSDSSTDLPITQLCAPNYLETPLLISDRQFQVGDQFIVNLNFGKLQKTKRTVYDWTEKTTKTRIYPLITGFKPNLDSVDEEIKDYGWFKIILEAKVAKSNDTVILSNITDKRQSYFLENQLDIIQSDYWFINEADVQSDENSTEYLQLDTERCQADDQYRTYPNILPGYLYIRTEIELPENFVFFENKSTGITSPYIFGKFEQIEEQE